MKTISRLFTYLIILCMTIILTGCPGDNAHDNEDARLASSIALALSWYDPADEGSSVTSFDACIYDTNGSMVYSRKGMTPKDVASTPIALPRGSYSASITDGTFYGVVSFDVTSDGLLIVDCPLKHIKSQLTFIVENAPAGSSLTGRVVNASKGWRFAMGADSKIALTLSTETATVELPKGNAADGVITTEPLWLMPTVPNVSKSVIDVEVTEADGTMRSSRLTCDAMLPGGKYTVKLNYNDISTLLTLSTVTINQWETLFVYEGEVLNPTN